MAKEDMFLPEMERLEIEPYKLAIAVASHDENPFRTNRTGPRKLAAARCGCSKKNLKNSAIFKRNHRELLKEPILKLQGKALLSKTNLTEFPIVHSTPSRCPLQTLNLETLNVCALVENDPPSDLLFSAPSFRELQRPQNREVAGSSGASNDRNRGSGPSCSQQALNPSCDVTIDELASYFETLVHIPKKMSTMAEMMYI